MCGSVYRTGPPIQLPDRHAGEKCSRAAVIGYGVSLDTRTTSVGKQPLTAMRRVHNVEGWRFYERGHEPDLAVLLGRWPGTALGGRCPGCLSGRPPAAARPPTRGRLVRRLAVHGVSSACFVRACPVPGIAPVH